jgi:hypothetical protein
MRTRAEDGGQAKVPVLRVDAKSTRAPAASCRNRRRGLRGGSGAAADGSPSARIRA